MSGKNTVEISIADSSTNVAYNAQATIDGLAEYTDVTLAVLGNTALIKTFTELSVSTGGYVQLLPQMSYMPVLIGSDEKPVYLYQLVEMFEGFLDYDAVLAEFPTLNFSQVTAAISFLRKVSQINSRQIDVDELEDEIDTGFLDELRQAFHDREVAARVLTDAI